MAITIQRDVQEVLITIQRDATIVELQPILKVSDGGGTAPSTTKQTFIATDNQTVFTLSPPSDNFIAFMGRNLAIEGIDYTYDAPDITFTTGQIANTRITVLKLS
jgi:hypothetical protein